MSYDFAEKNHGAFSYFLLDGLKGPADDNQDNIITVPDANKYVSTKMHEWCIEKGLQQNPTISYNVAGDFILVRVPQKHTLSFTVNADIEKATIKYEAEEKAKICDILDDIAFSSFEEIISDNLSNEQLTALILDEQNPEKKAEKIKLFLKEVATKRFSTKFATEKLMTIINKCLESKEIKKWIKQEEGIRKFLIIEFINSYNFDYAGTTAQIIEKLLPVLSDDEILEIVKNVKSNTQIIGSFKARSSLISIVDSCKSILPYKEYLVLRTSILGS